MKRHLHTDLHASCSGSYLVICGRVLSGAKCCARKFFPLLIVLSLIFSFPVSAGIISPVNGDISIEPDSFGYMYSRDSDEPHFRYNEDVPAYFEFSDDSYLFRWRDALPLLEMHSTYTSGDIVFSVLVNLGDGTDDLLVSFDSFSAQPFFTALFITGETEIAYFSYTGTLEMFVDDSLVYSVNLEHTQFPIIPSWQGTVNRYIEYRITTTSPSEHVYDWEEPHSSYEWLEVSLPGLLVNNVSTIIEDISISVSNIESGVDDIKDGIQDLNQTSTNMYVTVTQIEEGVVAIESEVTNMHDELSDSDSSIWQAGATVIKDSVKELFVPPQQELEAMQDQLELTIFTKAQPLFEAGTFATELSALVVETFSNAGTHGRSFDFPGISVPINGQVYELIPAQEVSITNDFVFTLQMFFAPFVGILCFLSLIHILEDAFYCIISGVSFWGFIKGRHDR